MSTQTLQSVDAGDARGREELETLAEDLNKRYKALRLVSTNQISLKPNPLEKAPERCYAGPYGQLLAWHGGYGRLWGSTATMAIYRISIGGVLCALILLASVVGLRWEVNTLSLLNTKVHCIRSAYNCLHDQWSLVV